MVKMCGPAVMFGHRDEVTNVGSTQADTNDKRTIGGPTAELSTLTRNALRRNPVIVAALVLFVALSAMLASSAAALVVTAYGAGESLMEQAKTPHFLQMHAGEVDEDRMTQFAADNDLVEQHELVPMLNVDGTAIRVTGEGTDTTLASGLQDNSFVAQSLAFDFLLDTDGQVIHPEPGTVWLPLYYRELLDLSTGQTLTVTGPQDTHELTVAGFLRDSQMNTSYASSKRILVSQPDLDALRETVGATGATEYLVQFRLTSPAAVSQFETDYRAAGLESNGPTITWSLFLLLNTLSVGITAAVMMLVTLLLVAIALLSVRFTLLTTIEQDYREIGVLKAIGVRNRDLGRLYSRRYLTMAVIGATVGLLASFGLNQLLLRDVHLYMGPAGRALPVVLVSVVLSAAVVGIVALTVRRTLRRLRLVSPVQAVRTGAASTDRVRGGSRLTGWLTAARSPLPTNLLLGLRDPLRKPQRYAVPLVIYTLASAILILPQNLHTTAGAPEFITYMGAGVSDMRVDVQQPADPARALELGKALAADPRVERHAVLTTAAYTAPDPTGTEVTVKLESGDLAAFPVVYVQGTIPQTHGDVALSGLQAEDLGATVGDTIVLTPSPSARTPDATADEQRRPQDEPLELTVSGIYQDVTNGGRTAKMVAPHTAGELMWSTVYADFVDGIDVPTTIAGFAADNPDLKVSSVRDYVDATIGGTISALRDAAIAALVVGLLVAAFVTALFMRMLMARDSFDIAAMKALGFRDGHIHLQYIVRSAVVLAVGVVLGAVLAGTLGGPVAGLMLSAIGISQLDLVANPWLAFVATPLALLVAVVIATLLSTRPSNRVSIAQMIKE